LERGEGGERDGGRVGSDGVERLEEEAGHARLYEGLEALAQPRLQVDAHAVDEDDRRAVEGLGEGE